MSSLLYLWKWDGFVPVLEEKYFLISPLNTASGHGEFVAMWRQRVCDSTRPSVNSQKEGISSGLEVTIPS